MPIVTWDPEQYSVKVEKIDSQHQKLFDLINQLHDAMKEGKSKQLIPQTLDSLLLYTKEHFTYEEMRMKQVEYPDLAEHQREHNEFVSQVTDFVNDYKSGKSGLNFKIINFLKQWLVEHIKQEDRRYIEYLEK